MDTTAGTETVAVIQQGAQYYLPLRIRMNGDVTSPDNVDDLKIKVGHVTAQLSKEELSYAGENWLFPLRQEDSLKFSGSVRCQASIKRGDNIYPSRTMLIHVDTSIITDGF
jgi:hypothetical protein